MPFKTIESAHPYKVGDGIVHLKVTIGPGQFGSSLVTVGDKEYDQARTVDVDLGSGADLKGKVAKVFSVVTDTNRQTNMTSVTYRLTGGPSPLEATLSVRVDQERDSVDYLAKFEMV